MKKWRAISLIFLVSIMLTPMIISFSLQIMITLAKLRAAEHLESRSMQVLCIKRSDVKWLSAGHELVIGNELFDVKEFAYTDKGLIVKGLFDSAETSLHKKNDDLYAGGKSRQGLIFLKYLQLVANCFYYPERGLIKLPVPVPRERIGFPDTYYSNIYLQIPSPPPKCFYSRSV